MTISTPEWLVGVLRTHADNMRVYLFGSWLHDPQKASDIDIAVVYPSGGLMEASNLITRLQECAPLPCDVVALSEAEEAELAFLAEVQAQLHWS